MGAAIFGDDVLIYPAKLSIVYSGTNLKITNPQALCYLKSPAWLILWVVPSKEGIDNLEYAYSSQAVLTPWIHSDAVACILIHETLTEIILRGAFSSSPDQECWAVLIFIFLLQSLSSNHHSLSSFPITPGIHSTENWSLHSSSEPHA